MATDIHEQLTKCLTDAHTIGEQALAQLRSAPVPPISLASTSPMPMQSRSRQLRSWSEDRSLPVIRGSRRSSGTSRGEPCPRAVDRGASTGHRGDPSMLKDAALRLGALNWAAFFRGHPDTPGNSPRAHVRSSIWRSASTSSSNESRGARETRRPRVSSSTYSRKNARPRKQLRPCSMSPSAPRSASRTWQRRRREILCNNAPCGARSTPGLRQEVEYA